MTIVYTNFFGGAFFGGGFFGAGTQTQVGGHGSEDGDRYDEPRRVIIAGKPFTVRSKGEYLALLRKFGRKDVPRETKQPAQEQAEAVIARAQDAARDSLTARQTAEIAALLHAKLKAQAAAGALDARALALRIEEGAIPIELLMLMAADL